MIAYHHDLTALFTDDDSILRTLLIVPIRHRYTRIHILPLVSRLSEIRLAFSQGDLPAYGCAGFRGKTTGHERCIP